jgi:receptor-type tyrosine-protein phosphatase Q
MGNLRKCIPFLVVSVNVVLAQAVDDTVIENAMGTDVVIATVSRIEKEEIFPWDKRLLRRIAYVETADGESPPSSGNDGGIWNVALEDFERTQDDPELADIRKEVNAAFSSDFISSNVRSWEFLAYRDLNRPLWSALAARLLIHKAEKSVDVPTASDISGQAVFWKTYYNEAGDMEKFRVDVEQLERDEGCKIKSDVIFVLDTSGSVGSHNFREVINFTLKFVENLNIGPTENQVGVILFNHLGIPIFNLSTYSDKESLLKGIESIEYRAGYTNIADGLCLLLEGFREENGARLPEGDVFRLAVVMTDGQSNRESEQCNNGTTMDVAEKVHNFSHPILVFAIGVTDNINEEELTAIATKEEYITYLDNFDERFFRETSDEQTYELCVKSTIPIPLGQQVGMLMKGGNVRYEIEVPEEGVTIRLCVREGYIIFYASFTVTNPNEALHDYKREVINTGTITCDDAFILPDVSNDATSKRNLRQVSNSTQSSSNILYISLEGGSEENEFALETSAGDNRVQDERQEEWWLIVIMLCVGLVLLLADITLLAVAFLLLQKRECNKQV